MDATRRTDFPQQETTRLRFDEGKQELNDALIRMRQTLTDARGNLRGALRHLYEARRAAEGALH